MINLYGLTEADLAQIVSLGQPRFRATDSTMGVSERCDQLFSNDHLPCTLRETLAESFCFGHLTIDMEQVSQDGTCKRLYD